MPFITRRTLRGPVAGGSKALLQSLHSPPSLASAAIRPAFAALALIAFAPRAPCFGRPAAGAETIRQWQFARAAEGFELAS